MRQILRISFESPGSAQLAVDISYVMNIMSAIGVPVSPLLTIYGHFEISKDELSERADEGTALPLTAKPEQGQQTDRQR